MTYPQKNLNEEQKQILFNFRSGQYSNESIIKILFSIQIMITYYNEQPYNDKDQRISETIKYFPYYFKIPQETKNLFSEYPFTMSHIISVYEYFELLCFKEFLNNIDPQYNQTLSKEKIKLIDDYFKVKEDPLLDKLTISTTIRRFISRSLVGIREDFEVQSEQELFEVLKYKEDCWNIEIRRNNNFEIEIEELKKLNIKVGEAVKLYEKLGGDRILLGETIKKQVEESELEGEEENNGQNKKNKDKKKKGKKLIF